MDTSRAKSQALGQLIEAIDDERRRAVTKAAISIAKTMEKERDKLAHRALGVCRELKDALLLVDLKDVISKAEMDFSNVMVYREKDFLTLIAGNLRLCEYLMSLRQILRRPPPPEGDQLLDALYKTPEIQERLGRPVSPTQSAQAGPP